MTPTPTTKQKVLKGTVVSTKAAKTAVVLVKRYVKHPKYGKFVSISKRYKAHDPEGRCVEGEDVSIRACRPISKDKHFAVIYQ